MQLKQLFPFHFDCLTRSALLDLTKTALKQIKEKKADENATCLGYECVVLFDQRDTHALS